MSTDNPVADLLQGAPEAGKKREFAGFKGTLRINLEGYSANIPIRYAKIDTAPMFDLGPIRKVGPNGQPVTSRREDHYYENGQEIQESQIRRVQEQDGADVEVGELHRTQTLDIDDTRQLEACTLVDEQTLTQGCVIPREDVDKYAPESTYIVWGEGHYDLPLLRVAEILEKRRHALFFPFSFGRGFTIHECLMYPVRIDGQVYFVLVFNVGQKKFKHALRAEGQVEKEAKVVVLAAPRLRRKPQGIA